MAKGKYRILAVVLSFIILGMLTRMAWAEEVARMGKEVLKSMLGNPEVVIIDVRARGDWDNSKVKIQGAMREDPDRNVKSWAEKYSKDKTVILYCAWPSEGTSARVARELISLGFKKVYALKGGWKEWSKANFPTEEK